MKPTSLIPHTPPSLNAEFQKSHKELILSATEIQLLQMPKSLVSLLWLLPREGSDSSGKGILRIPGQWGLFS